MRHIFFSYKPKNVKRNVGGKSKEECNNNNKKKKMRRRGW